MKKTHFVIKSISSALFHLKVSTARENYLQFRPKEKKARGGVKRKGALSQDGEAEGHG